MIAALKRLYRRVYTLGGIWGDFREEYLRPIRPTQEQERVLDAGCGQGQLKLEFERFGRRVDYYGVDLAVGDIDWKFRVTALADLEALPFKANSFDKVISMEVLEHVDRPESVFEQMSRVLVPGGMMYLALPFVWHLHQEPHDRYRFTRTALEYLATKYKLNVLAITPMGGYFSVIRYLISNYSFIGSKSGAAWQWTARLLNLPLKWFDTILLAPITYLLDFLDTEKKLTLGYHVILQKPGELPKLLTEDPYACPACSKTNLSLKKTSECWSCQSCQRNFPVIDGIPRLTLEGSYQPKSRAVVGI